MNPQNWTRNPVPVFFSDETNHPGNLYGTGHNCFIKVKNKNYIVYHATHNTGSQYTVDGIPKRFVMAQEFVFDQSGIPVFGGSLFKPGTSFDTGPIPQM